jgi:hypothetical protein
MLLPWGGRFDIHWIFYMIFFSIKLRCDVFLGKKGFHLKISKLLKKDIFKFILKIHHKISLALLTRTSFTKKST